MPKVSIVFEDSEGIQTAYPWYIDPAVATVADVQTGITALVNSLNTISGCFVAAASVEFPLTVPASAADSGYVNQSGAFMSFYNNAATPRASAYYVPGLLLSKISGGVVESSDVDIAAFITGMVSGWGAGNMSMTDENYLDLTAYRVGKLTTRKTRAG